MMLGVAEQCPEEDEGQTRLLAPAQVTLFIQVRGEAGTHGSVVMVGMAGMADLLADSGLAAGEGAL